MTELSASPQAETSFAAILTPHRSLGPKGFAVLMGAVCIISFSTGLLFYLIGAWPVVGFMTALWWTVLAYKMRLEDQEMDVRREVAAVIANAD